MVAVAHRARADALEVRPRARLGHRDRADQFAARHARQPALLLLLGAVIEHVVRRDAVHALAEAGNATPVEFLVQQRFVTEVATAATVFRGHVHQQESGRTDLAPRLLVHAMIRPPLRVQRQHLGVDITGNRLAQHAEVVVHPGGFVGFHGKGMEGLGRLGRLEGVSRKCRRTSGCRPVSRMPGNNRSGRVDSGIGDSWRCSGRP